MNPFITNTFFSTLLFSIFATSIVDAQTMRMQKQNPNHTRVSLDQDDETILVSGELTKNSVKSKIVLEMHAANMAKCWTGEIASCQIAWDGMLNGRKVGNHESGSTYTRHTFHRSLNRVYMVMLDCGPYVGTCEYSWVGVYNSKTQSYDGEISFYPATYGFLRVYTKSAKLLRRK